MQVWSSSWCPLYVNIFENLKKSFMDCIKLCKIRSEMEARIALLRTTISYVNDIIMMETLLASME